MNETQVELKQESFRDANDDPGFLVAKGKFDGSDSKAAEKRHIKKLASAVFMAMVNHGYARIRAVGPFANHNAVKAMTIASGYCAPRGIELCWVSSFDEGNLGKLRKEGHVETVNATVYDVRGWKEWEEDLSKLATQDMVKELIRRGYPVDIPEEKN